MTFAELDRDIAKAAARDAERLSERFMRSYKSRSHSPA